MLSVLNLKRIERKVDHTKCHHCHSACHSDCILSKAHAEREYGASKKTHDHKTGDFVLLLWLAVECLGKHNAEDIRVAEPYASDGSKHEKL